jgi:hypothetical protein
MKKVIFAVGMKRILLLIAALLLTALTLAAQEKQPSELARLGLNYLKSLTAPKKSLDSTYVFQPTLKWSIALESQYLRTGADLHNDITLTDFLEDKTATLSGTMDTGLRNEPYQKVGLAAGYGSLHIGYGIQLGKKSKLRNSYFSLGTTSSFYGARARYFKIHQYPEGKLAIAGDVLDFDAEYPGELRYLSLDAFYAFNRHRFVYTAVYDGRILQRRSAGSWLVAAKYSQGDFSLDEKDHLWAQLNDLQRYAAHQVSAGGGYSFNWVILHRDPTDPASAAGLRTLTLNATILCRLSLLNHIHTEQLADGGGFNKVRYEGQPALSPTFQSGLCYTWARCCFSASVEYNNFNFRGIETEIPESDNNFRTKVQTRGAFYDFTVQGKVIVRF